MRVNKEKSGGRWIYIERECVCVYKRERKRDRDRESGSLEE